jgi:hypothetical protein
MWRALARITVIAAALLLALTEPAAACTCELKCRGIASQVEKETYAVEYKKCMVEHENDPRAIPLCQQVAYEQGAAAYAQMYLYCMDECNKGTQMIDDVLGGG